jgi:hypothetical protein
MLIKRNVYFSAVDQETGEEKLFSVNEVMDESEYLEKLYAETETKKGLSTGKKVALGAAGTAAAAAGVIYGGKKVGKVISDNARKALNNPHVSLIDAKAVRKSAQEAAKKAGAKGAQITNAGNKAVKEANAKAVKSYERKINIGDALQKPADKITGVVKKIGNRASGYAQSAGQKAETAYYKAKEGAAAKLAKKAKK